MPVVVCPNCGAKNRVDPSRSASKKPICGRCKSELPSATSNEPIILTDDTFANALTNAGEKVMLVDCWAEWCGPCRMLTPTIEALAHESNGRWVIAKLNTDQNQRTAAQFGISALPTLLIFKNGVKIDELVGLQPKQAIVQRLVRAEASRR